MYVVVVVKKIVVVVFWSLCLLEWEMCFLCVVGFVRVCDFLFRMFQEMLNNILKHSRASHVIVSILYSQDNKFVLRMQDDGIGFEPQEKKKSVNASSGLGLKSMVNRARLIGAEISIQSKPGNGTLIQVELPVES